MSGRSALLLGATGAVGKKLLAELLASNEWNKIGEFGRSVTAPENMPPGQRDGRLEQKVIDFEDLDAAGLKDGRWDVVFVTLGTTRAQAGSAERFEKIDRECVHLVLLGFRKLAYWARGLVVDTSSMLVGQRSRMILHTSKGSYIYR